MSASTGSPKLPLFHATIQVPLTSVAMSRDRSCKMSVGGSRATGADHVVPASVDRATYTSQSSPEAAPCFACHVTTHAPLPSVARRGRTLVFAVAAMGADTTRETHALPST